MSNENRVGESASFDKSEKFGVIEWLWRLGPNVEWTVPQYIRVAQSAQHMVEALGGKLQTREDAEFGEVYVFTDALMILAYKDAGLPRSLALSAQLPNLEQLIHNRNAARMEAQKQ